MPNNIGNFMIEIAADSEMLQLLDLAKKKLNLESREAVIKAALFSVLNLNHGQGQ